MTDSPVLTSVHQVAWWIIMVTCNNWNLSTSKLPYRNLRDHCCVELWWLASASELNNIFSCHQGLFKENRTYSHLSRFLWWCLAWRSLWLGQSNRSYPSTPPDRCTSTYCCHESHCPRCDRRAPLRSVVQPIISKILWLIDLAGNMTRFESCCKIMEWCCDEMWWPSCIFHMTSDQSI